jgi:hypothetical protein
VERNWLSIRRSPCNKRSTYWSILMCCKKTSWITFWKKCLYSTYSSFLVINVCNQGKTLCLPCIIKSSHITFTLRKCHCSAVNINQTVIPQAESVKYLSVQFDCRLTWKDHIAKKRKQINLKIKEINWLIGRKSHLSIENKVLIYKAIIKPIWSYGIELWGCAS